MVRAHDARATSTMLTERVDRCFEAGALATGAELDHRRGRCRLRRDGPRSRARRRSTRERRGARPRLRSGRRGCAVLDRHGQRLARRPVDPPDASASTPWRAVNHQPEFAAAARSRRRPTRPSSTARWRWRGPAIDAAQRRGAARATDGPARPTCVGDTGCRSLRTSTRTAWPPLPRRASRSPS